MPLPTSYTTARLMKCGGWFKATGIGCGVSLQPPFSLPWQTTFAQFSNNGFRNVSGASGRLVIEFSRFSTKVPHPLLSCVAPSSSPYSQVSSSEDKPAEEKEKETTASSIHDLANLLEIRVGRILKAWKHEEADSLYVEEVDVGESEPRIICSGLANYIPLSDLQGIDVVVLANLKPRNMRGVKSNGMLMAASDSSHSNVELLRPPPGSVTGERLWFGSPEDHLNQPPPATPNQLQKKKIWESVQPHLRTDESCRCCLEDQMLRSSSGVVVSKSLTNANVS